MWVKLLLNFYVELLDHTGGLVTYNNPLKPPYRADQVGSLLRPKHLHEARAKYVAGEILDDEPEALEE